MQCACTWLLYMSELNLTENNYGYKILIKESLQWIFELHLIMNITGINVTHYVLPGALK